MKKAIRKSVLVVLVLSAMIALAACGSKAEEGEKPATTTTSFNLNILSSAYAEEAAKPASEDAETTKTATDDAATTKSAE
jgi:uncharacterized lipoprotein YehR (DUF1307 family)